MADGTVRGTFDLNTQPAVSGVRSYRQEAERADLVTKSLGQSIDDAFGGSERQRIESVASAMKDVGTASTTAREKWGQNWAQMRRDTERDATVMVAAIDKVHDRMQMLSRERATPTIDLDGITKALAQVELLHQRIQALGRERATPRVGIGGGFTGAGGGAAGGAGRGGAFAFTGSGGSGLGFGPLRGGSMAAGAAIGLPALTSLAGSATGLVSSATGAAVGAGSVALAGLAPLVAGIGATIAIAKPGVTAIQNVQKAQAAYTKTVREYGRDSKQAQVAAAALDRTYAKQPGLRRATGELQAFKHEWATLSAPARAQFFGGVADVTRIGRRAAPQLARNSTIATGAVRRAAVSQASFLTGSAMQDNLSFFTRSFAHELPVAEHTLENVELTLSNIARAATPFFREGNLWVEHWTHGWATSTSNISATRREIEPMVADFKNWERLTGSTFRLLHDIGHEAAPSGNSLVMQLTDTFDRWDQWVKDHPEQTRQWFDDAASSTGKMASALGGVVHWLNQMSTLLRPILNDFSDLVRAASRLGLLGTPGAAAALFGAYRGVSGGMGGAAAGGARGGMMPMFLGGGGGGAARAGGGVMLGGGGAGATSYLAPRAAATAAAPAGMLGFTGLALSRLYRRKNVGIIGSREFAGRAGALATPEEFAGRYGAVAGARYAAPVSELGAAASAGSKLRGLGGLAGGALKGAARGFAPVALGIGALDLLGGQGNFGFRSRTALSDMTLGLLPHPFSQQDVNDSASSSTQKFVGGLKGSPKRRISAINTQIQQLMGRDQHRVSGSHRFIGGGDNSFFGIGLGGGQTTDQQYAENRKRIELLRQERTALRETNAEMVRQRRARADDKARRTGYAYGSTLGGAYDVYRKAGQSPVAAADSTVTQVKDKLAKIPPAGIEALGESSLAWARAMAKANPALSGEVDKLNASIEARFRKMGRRVAIIHGDILTGTKTEWSQIGEAMTTPAEQAREKVTADFTLIQQKAVGSLTAMGFSKGDATKLVGALEKGGSAGSAATQIVSNTQQGVAGPVKGEGKVFGAKKARGGIIGGRGLSDTVPVAGGLAAPGEAWIANRHTLSDLSRATIKEYGLTAQQMIRGETRRHSMTPVAGRAARGGRYAYGGVTPAVANMISRLDGMGFHHGSTTGGRHAKNSLHYRGEAVDYGDASNDMRRLWSVVYPQRARFAELFGPHYLKAPTLMHYGAGFSDAALQAEHNNHIHLGWGGGGGALGALKGGVGGFGFKKVKLHGVGMKQPGVPGVMRARAGDIYAKGLQTKINHALARAGGGASLAGFTGGGAPSANQSLGRRMMLAAGYGGDQWSPLKSLWNQESGWNANAVNKSSGAYGIPQSLGHGHPYALGDAAAQIRWGLGYIRGRYGTPAKAWAHEQAFNWYGRGGQMKFAGAFDKGGSFTTNGPTAFVAGEGRNRRERVNVTPVKKGSRGRGNVTIEHLTVTVKIDGGTGGGDLRAIGEHVAQEIIDALDRGLSGVVD